MAVINLPFLCESLPHERGSPFLHPTESGPVLWPLWPMECGESSVLEPLSPGVKKAWQLLLLCSWRPEPHVKSPGYSAGKRGQCGKVLGDEKMLAERGPMEDHWCTSMWVNKSCWIMWGTPPETPNIVKQGLFIPAVPCPDCWATDSWHKTK